MPEDKDDAITISVDAGMALLAFVMGDVTPDFDQAVAELDEALGSPYA